MSETSSELQSPSKDTPLDTDEFWSREKVRFFRDYLMQLQEWPLAEACILLLYETDFIFVQLLRRHYDADELATGEFRRNTITRELGLPSTPPRPDALRIVYSRTLDAIYVHGLPNRKDAHGVYHVQPIPFLKWAKKNGYFIPNGLFVEVKAQVKAKAQAKAKAQYNWDDAGLRANECRFARCFLNHVLLHGDRFRSGLGRIKVAPLIEDMVKLGNWPKGVKIPKDLRRWNALGTYLLGVHDQARF